MIVNHDHYAYFCTHLPKLMCYFINFFWFQKVGEHLLGGCLIGMIGTILWLSSLSQSPLSLQIKQNVTVHHVTLLRQYGAPSRQHKQPPFCGYSGVTKQPLSRHAYIYCTLCLVKTCGATRNPKFLRIGLDWTKISPGSGHVLKNIFKSGRVRDKNFGPVQVRVVLTRLFLNIFFREFRGYSGIKWKHAWHSHTE